MRRFLPFLALLIAGCADLPFFQSPEPQPQRVWSEHSAALAEVSNWSVTGRISIRTEGDAWNATLLWQQRDDAYRIRLVAPLGQGTVQISGDENGVTLRTAENKVYTAKDAETLMLDTLGWNVPVRGLRYWMLGLDEPGVAAKTKKFGQNGLLSRLHQTGWEINFLRYELVQGLELPTKLFLENRQLAVRIVVTRWETDTT
ncbi:MAG: outer membrane lipoprotein LolB [Gammaproteobacteria bacterium]|nr:outer membrane lipoprotein LolB [Gammaproteobacteria bacterium]